MKKTTRCSLFPALPLRLFVMLVLGVTMTAMAGRDPAQLRDKIAPLVSHGAVILHDETGKELFSMNGTTLLIPASIIKILTGIVSLDVLGKEYRFKTEIYRDSTSNLLVKGWGDPFLISEEIDLIARELHGKGITSIGRLVLDHSSFVPDVTVPGVSRTLNPYDAINGALVVNFNTLNIGRDAGGSVYSAEEVTPLTPLALAKATLIKAGAKDRISLLDNRDECLRYAGELFQAIFKKNGIAIRDETLSSGVVSSSWSLVMTYKNSKTLADVVRELQKYSNNFIANQLFLTVGAQKGGYPASLEKGTVFFQQYVKNTLGLPETQIAVAEGSGISRNNRVTGVVMMRMVESFRANAELLPEKKGVLVKSGTLSGVYNYAGYIRTPNGLCPFVIMLNQSRNTRDKILSLLSQYCSAP